MKFTLLSPNIISLRCNRLNPATLLPEETKETDHDWLTLTNQRGLPRDDAMKQHLLMRNLFTE